MGGPAVPGVSSVKPRRVSISLYTWGNAAFDTAVGEAARAGFEFVELNQAVLDLTDPAVVREAGAALRDYEVRPATMHASGGRLAASDTAERDAAVAAVAAAATAPAGPSPCWHGTLKRPGCTSPWRTCRRKGTVCHGR